MRGRFQAFAVSASGVRRLIGESPQIHWRSTSPPGPTQTAVVALDALTSRLAEAGWSVAGCGEEQWFGLVLSRPAAAGDGTPRSGEDDRDDAPSVRNEPQLDFGPARRTPLSARPGAPSDRTRARPTHRCRIPSQPARRIPKTNNNAPRPAPAATASGRLRDSGRWRSSDLPHRLPLPLRRDRRSADSRRALPRNRQLAPRTLAYDGVPI